jgi:hypothetical protein
MEETAAMGVGAGLVQGLIGYLITIVVALATASMIALVVKGLGKLKTVPKPSAEPVPAVALPTQVDESEIARRVAVVAAAVATVAGGRVVQIGEAPIPGMWRTTGRALHHGSHTPHR